MLGSERIERPPERVREVDLVDHAVLVQRFNQDDVRSREPGQRVEQGVELRLLGAALSYR